MLKKILIVLGFVILVFIVLVALRPDDFTVSRTVVIAAPPAASFAQVNDFHKWAAWSPFEKLDVTMTKTFSGTESGTGAIYEWSGNAKAGAGKMTIIESKPGELIKMKLEFIKPFAATNQAEFTFKSVGDKTEVTWTMTGRNTFLFKAFQVFVSMDKMVGKDFEEGLAKLKTIAEAEPKAPAPAAPVAPASPDPSKPVTPEAPKP